MTELESLKDLMKNIELFFTHQKKLNFQNVVAFKIWPNFC